MSNFLYIEPKIPYHYYCGVTTLNLSNLDTSILINLSRAFTDCLYISVLNINSWNTSKVTNMNSVFNYCASLTTINGVIDMSSCTNCDLMFYFCDKLRGVHLKNVPRSLDLSEIGGTEGVTYIIDNYID